MNRQISSLNRAFDSGASEDIVAPKHFFFMGSNLQSLGIYQCQYETVRPLAKFRNLETISWDFVPPKSEIFFENSRTVECLAFSKYYKLIFLVKAVPWPKVRKIKCKFNRIDFDTPQAVHDFGHDYKVFVLLKDMENYKGCTMLGLKLIFFPTKNFVQQSLLISKLKILRLIF